MSVQKAFELSWNLMQKGIKHKVSKRSGQWNVVVIGDKK